LIAKAGSPDHTNPTSADRTLADLIDPTRPGSVMVMVNATSREVGQDVAQWSFMRIWGLYVQLETEAREREREQSDL